MRLILIRGGGDLASGVSACLFRAGYYVFITEQRNPASVRRKVSFSEAVYDGKTVVEGISAKLADNPLALKKIMDEGYIPVIVDPNINTLDHFSIDFLVDARMMKRKVKYELEDGYKIIGLGPGFEVGLNCDYAVETMRGTTLGDVIYQGSPIEDTGIPGVIGGRSGDRVLRAPAKGVMSHYKEIGDFVKEGDLISEVDGSRVIAPFDGVIRGLIHPSFSVTHGMKIGDVDPRNDPELCFKISDKALKIGGAVLKIVQENAENK